MECLSVQHNPNKDYHLDKIPAIDIEFEDLSYFVKNAEAEQKQILKSISGRFSSGQLTGILGASGAGKSTLLNILAGYVFNGVHGNVKINGAVRKINAFNKLSTFVMQENLFQPYLTVNEEMMMVANLKLGNSVGHKKKQSTVDEILRLLRLSNCHTTEIKRLSGGQEKRLSIALELIGNPSVIFLDEPTTGLDTVATQQCIEVLKLLTDEGRTVVCTIHQPSVTILQQFHQVYFITNGMCVYNGPVTNIPRFLSSVQLECSLTHSLADFIIEIVDKNPNVIPVLVEVTKNGKKYVEQMKETNLGVTKEEVTSSEETLSVTSFWTQFYVLLCRMMLQQRRNKFGLWIQFFNYTTVGLLIGSSYFGIGSDASQMIPNVRFCVFTQLYLVFCSLMTPVMQFPFEVKILKQEYFKHWYGLKAFYFAATFRSFPLMVFLIMEFSLIVYLMTDQPLDLGKFFKFLLTTILTHLISDGIGLAVGAIFNSTNGSVVAPTIVCPWFIVVTIGFGYMDQVSSLVKFVMKLSFAQHIFLAMNLALYSDRGQLPCPEEELFCYYKNPSTFLKDLGAANTTYQMEILTLIGFVIFFRVVAYILLQLRLNPERLIIFYKNVVYKIKKLN